MASEAGHRRWFRHWPVACFWWRLALRHLFAFLVCRGVISASSAPSVCGITLFTGVVGGGGLAGSSGSGAAAPPGERAILRFLLALVSMVLEAAC